MEKEEILNHRKNKFLSIGRNKGFTTQTGLSENLTMKENKFDQLINKIKSDKKIIYIIYWSYFNSFFFTFKFL